MPNFREIYGLQWRIAARDLLAGDAIELGLMRGVWNVEEVFERDGHVYVGFQWEFFNMPRLIFVRYARDDRVTIRRRPGCMQEGQVHPMEGLIRTQEAILGISHQPATQAPTTNED